MKILLAEDDSAVVVALIDQLRSLGHEVVGEAATGRQAVQLAEETRPELVVMDIMMPDGDGIEAARQIAEKCPVPVVFLTGHFDEELLSGVVESGGMAYLLKPATADQLQAGITLARARFDEMADLRAQATRLVEALETRKLITRAKGLLMQRRGLTEEEAHRSMQKEASRGNMKLVDLARAILTADVFVGNDDTGAGPAAPRTFGEEKGR